MKVKMNKEVKEALKILIENNLSSKDIDSMFEEINKPKQVNYEFECGEELIWVDNLGQIVTSNWTDFDVDRAMNENFNAFPTSKRKLVEYIVKKQLLERKLLVYSDIFGTEDIDWNDSSIPKYYIHASINEGDKFESYVSNMYCYSNFASIYFNTKKGAEKALEDNKNLIKEVMLMQRNL